MKTTRSKLKPFESKKIEKPSTIVGGDRGPIERDRIKKPKAG